MRRVGPVVSHTDFLVDPLRETARVYNAAEIFLTSPSDSEIRYAQDIAGLHDADTSPLNTLQLYAAAPVGLALSVAITRRRHNHERLTRQLEYANHLGAHAYVLPVGLQHPEVAVACETLKYLPRGMEVLLENTLRTPLADLVPLVEALRVEGFNIGICFNTAIAWSGGDPALHDPALLPTTHLRLLHLNNLAPTVFCGSRTMGRDLPSLARGAIPISTIQTLLQALPNVPVTLNRHRPALYLRDAALVRAIDANDTYVIEDLAGVDHDARSV